VLKLGFPAIRHNALCSLLGNVRVVL